MSSDTTKPGSEESQIRILLLGKAGTGKSSVGNTILGLTTDKSERFKIGGNFGAMTTECELKTGTYQGSELKVLDTPGLLLAGDEDNEGPSVVEKLVSGIQQIHPGPHAIIVVLKHQKFEYEDVNLLKALKKSFMNAYDYIIFVFTERKTIKEEGAKDAEIPSELVLPGFTGKAQFQTCTIKPEAAGYQEQPGKLLDTIIRMKKSHNTPEKHYCNDMLERDAKMLFKELDKPKPEPDKSIQHIVDCLIESTLDIFTNGLHEESLKESLKALVAKMENFSR